MHIMNTLLWTWKSGYKEKHMWGNERWREIEGMPCGAADIKIK